jgi:hypothetical protein
MSSLQVVLSARRRAPKRGKLQSPRTRTRWSRRGPGRGGVDADVVYADEGIAESVKLKPREVDDVEDKVVEVFFSKLSI